MWRGGTPFTQTLNDDGAVQSEESRTKKMALVLCSSLQLKKKISTYSISYICTHKLSFPEYQNGLTQKLTGKESACSAGAALGWEDPLE